MSGKTILGVLVTMVAVAGLFLLKQPLPAAEREPQKDAKQNSISVDVVIEEVDLSSNTISARSTLYVIPPHDNVGGAALATGTTDAHKDKATKYVRLPVMPAAKLVEKKPQVGERAVLRLELRQQGFDSTLVVVGIDGFTGLERIGVDFLDAPGTKDAK